MRRYLTEAVATIMIAISVAGCVSDPPSEAASDDAGPAPVPEANATAAAIAGLITDEEGQPIVGASVALVELAFEVRSDAAGRFTFNGLDPGTYKLFVTRLGFESAAKQVEVLQGQIVEVDVVLRAIAIEEDVWTEAHPFAAYIELGHAWTDYYGAWDVLPTCSSCDFYFHITPNPSDFQSEIWYEKSVDLPIFMTEVYYLFRTGWDNNSVTSQDDASSVVSGYWYDGPMPIAMSESGDRELATENLDESGESDLQLKVGGGFYSVAFQQRIDGWVSLAHNGEFASDYSAFPPQ